MSSACNFFFFTFYSIPYKDFNNADKSDNLWLLLLKIILYHPDISFET